MNEITSWAAAVFGNGTGVAFDVAVVPTGVDSDAAVAAGVDPDGARLIPATDFCGVIDAAGDATPARDVTPEIASALTFNMNARIDITDAHASRAGRPRPIRIRLLHEDPIATLDPSLFFGAGRLNPKS